jgi:hypothetical protein
VIKINSNEKILILSIMWVFISPLSHLKAQDTLSYKPLTSFEGDTVAYLEYNFNIRHKQYAGKKVSDIIKDLELPVIEITEFMTGTREPRTEQGQPPSGILQMSLCLIKSGKEPDPFQDYYITFSFKNPPPLTSILPLMSFRRWSPELYEFIKDLEISAIGTLLYKEVNTRYIEYIKRK